MDIGVKERVIGAVVLVILGIIIIPWVLQGPSPDTAVTHSVALPAATTSSAPQEYRMDLNGNQAQSPVSGPAPAVSQPATPQSANPQPAVPQQAAAPPAARPNVWNEPVGSAPAVTQPKVVERTTPVVKTVGEGWLIQAGSYGSERNALKLQVALKQHGYAVHVSRYSVGRKTYYRVRVGPYAQRAAAEKAVPAINRIYGGKAKVVPAD
jgi:DedD protein